jgi:hypothetical protein
VVRALTPGQTQIIATATADNTVRAAVQITVVPVAVPTISLQTINQGGTNAPVAINNVFGQIDIVANLEVPAGVQISRVEWLIDQTVVCTQQFASPAEVSANADEALAQVPVTCSANTAAFNATTGAVTFPNGNHSVSVRVIGPQGTVVASSPTNQFSNLTFNNTSFINATIASSRSSAVSGAGPRSLAPVGSLWNAGDITFNMLSVNFAGAAGALGPVTITITTSGRGVTGVAGCTSNNDAANDPTIAVVDGGGGAVIPVTDPNGTTPNCTAVSAARMVTAPASGMFPLTFPENAAMSAAAPGVQNVEDILTIAVAAVTTQGQPGPTCINPTPQLNPLGPACTTFFPNPLRVDNLAPRITQLNIIRQPPAPEPLVPSPPTNNFFAGTAVPLHAVESGAACTAPAGSSPPSGPCARTVDYGVDSQTAAGNATFQAGASSSSLVDVTANFNALPETPTAVGAPAQPNLFQLTVKDALNNSRARFATADITVVTTSTGSALLFGIDKTLPALTVVLAPPDNGANDGTTYQSSCTDVATTPVIPSGCPPATQILVKVERLRPTSPTTACLNPNTGAVLGGQQSGCATNNGFFGDDGLFNIGNPSPVTNAAYYRVTQMAQDFAGNVSAAQTLLTLLDQVPPVLGNVNSPSTITGNTTVNFSADATDNIDLGDATPFILYANGLNLANPASSIGQYGPAAFTTSAVAQASAPNFIRGVQTLGQGSFSNANNLAFVVRDAAGVVDNIVCPPAGTNCAVTVLPITAAVTAGITASNPQTNFATGGGVTGGFTGWTIAASNATVCNGTTQSAGPTPQPCPTNPTNTSLTASLTTQNPNLGTPFERVNFYAQNAGGVSSLIGTATAGTSSVSGGVTTVAYTFSWTPLNVTPGVYQVFAIGVNNRGDGLINAAAVAITIVID